MIVYLASENYLQTDESHLIGLFGSGLSMLIGSVLFPEKNNTTYELP
jgi:hypothetical protein